MRWSCLGSVVLAAFFLTSWSSAASEPQEPTDDELELMDSLYARILDEAFPLDSGPGISIRFTGAGVPEFFASLTWVKSMDEPHQLVASSVEAEKNGIRAQMIAVMMESEVANERQLSSALRFRQQEVDEGQCPRIREIYSAFDSQWLDLTPPGPPFGDVIITADGTSMAFLVNDGRTSVEARSTDPESLLYKWGLNLMRVLRDCGE